MLVDVVAEILPPIEPAELDRIAQFIWATNSSPVYRMLVDGQGWTPDRFEEWVFRLYCTAVGLDPIGAAGVEVGVAPTPFGQVPDVGSTAPRRPMTAGVAGKMVVHGDRTGYLYFHV